MLPRASFHSGVISHTLVREGVWNHFRQWRSTCSFVGHRSISLSPCFSTLVPENAIFSHFFVQRLVLGLFCCLNILPFCVFRHFTTHLGPWELFIPSRSTGFIDSVDFLLISSFYGCQRELIDTSRSYSYVQ